MADDKLIFDLLTGQNTLVKDLGTIQTSVNSIEKNFNSFPKTVSNAFAGVGSSIALVGAGVTGAIVAFNKLSAVFHDSIKGAEEQEDAINRLNTALQASGDFTEAASLDFQEYASNLQKVSRIGDEVTLANLALLKSLAPLTNEGLKAANTAAVNLSTALRIDLESAVRLVGKAANGNVEAFKKYGVEIRKGKTDAESFANTINTLNERFGNAAANDINTYSGSVAQLKNSYSDVLEEIGNFIIKNDTVIASVKTSTGFFDSLARSIKDYAENNRESTKIIDCFLLILS